jgi:hypothetical protein
MSPVQVTLDILGVMVSECLAQVFLYRRKLKLGLAPLQAMLHSSSVVHTQVQEPFMILLSSLHCHLALLCLLERLWGPPSLLSNWQRGALTSVHEVRQVNISKYEPYKDKG